jgi:hypothetical protein
MNARVSRAGGGAPGHHPTAQAPDASLQPGVRAGNGLPDADLDRWLADPKAGAVTIRLVCDAETTLVVRDPATVEAMLRSEVERRKQARDGLP